MRNPRVHSRRRLAVCLGLLIGTLSITLAAGAQAPTRFRQGLPTDPNSSRTLVLMFDFTSQPTEAQQRAVAAGLAWVEKEMTDRDRVAVVAVDARVRVVSDFTLSRDAIGTALRSASLTDAAAPGVETLANTPVPTTTPDARDDVRLGSLATVCEMLRAIPERKSILYFSNGLSSAVGTAEQAQLRRATTACNRADVSIYAVDGRGLLVADASGASRPLQLP